MTTVSKLLFIGAMGVVGCGQKSENSTAEPAQEKEPAVAASGRGSGAQPAAPTAAPPSPAPPASSAAARPAPAKPTVLAQGQNRPVAVAVAGDTVYWVNHGLDANGKEQLGLGSVSKAPLAGGEPVVVAAKQDMPGAIVVDEKAVYWTNLHGVKKAPRDGVAVTNLVTLGDGDPHGMPFSLGIDADTIYLGTMHVSNGGLFKSGKGGGGLKDVNAGFSVADAVTADDAFVYVCVNGDVLGRIPHGGGAKNAVVLGKALRNCAGVAVDSAFVYFTEAGAGTVKRVPKTGGAVTLVAGDLAEPHEVAVEHGNVYVLEWRGARLVRAPAGGGAPVVLADGLKAARGLAVTKGVVVWAEAEAGTVSKLATE